MTGEEIIHFRGFNTNLASSRSILKKFASQLPKLNYQWKNETLTSIVNPAKDDQNSQTLSGKEMELQWPQVSGNEAHKKKKKRNISSYLQPSRWVPYVCIHEFRSGISLNRGVNPSSWLVRQLNTWPNFARQYEALCSWWSELVNGENCRF